MNETITICSTPQQVGNHGNIAHHLTVSGVSTAASKSCISLKLSNHWRDNKEYDFNISREAAADLMLALDVILSIDE